MKYLNEGNTLKSALYVFVVVFFLAASFVWSCRRKLKETPSHLNLVCNPVELNLEFYIPLQISYINGRFFVADFHGERMIREIDGETFLSMGDFGLRGRGPSEFLGPLLTWEFNNKLYVFDRRAFNVGFFDVNIPDSLKGFKYTNLFHVDNSLNQLISLDKNLYLAAGYFESGRYALLDSLGRVVHFFGDYPDFKVGEEKIPFDVKAMFHQVKFTPNYEKSRIAALSGHVLDIIDFADNEPIVHTRTKLADYAYMYQSGAMVRAELKDGFAKGARSVAACSQFVYVLFNHRVKGIEAGEEPYYSEILVFDWEGKLVAKKRALCDLSLIKAVDGNRIFGITTELDLVFLSNIEN